MSQVDRNFRVNVVDNCGYCGAVLTLQTQHSHFCEQRHEANRQWAEKAVGEIVGRHIAESIRLLLNITSSTVKDADPYTLSARELHKLRCLAVAVDTRRLKVKKTEINELRGEVERYKKLLTAADAISFTDLPTIVKALDGEWARRTGHGPQDLDYLGTALEAFEALAKQESE